MAILSANDDIVCNLPDVSNIPMQDLIWGKTKHFQKHGSCH